MARRKTILGLTCSVAIISVVLFSCSAGFLSFGSSNSYGTSGAGTSNNHQAGVANGNTTLANNANATGAVHAVTAAQMMTTAAYVTTDDLSLALANQPLTLSTNGKADVVITVDTATTYQSVLGFGASVTDSSSQLIKALDAGTQLSVLQKLFSVTAGIGLSFLRQPMGASDFSTVGNFSYDDLPSGQTDLAMAKFNLTQDLKATIPVLRQAISLNPSLFILATPWSPPAWMKSNNSMSGTANGGDCTLLASQYPALANYFVAFIKGYQAQGIKISAITLQNEPLNTTAAYPGSNVPATTEAIVIGQHLGPALKAANLSTQIFSYDHNWDVEAYPETTMSDAVAAPFVDGAAFHCYAGEASAMTTFHTNHPNKNVYMTECSGGAWQSDALGGTMTLLINSMNNWARSVSLWNVALNSSDGPTNNGCSNCRGLVTLNGAQGVTYNADYFGLGHMSMFLAPGSKRIASKTSDSSISQVAFTNTTGATVVVVYNTSGSSKSVAVTRGQQTYVLSSVPNNAAATLIVHAP